MTLEQFILNNLEELNQAEPSAKIWQKLRNKLDEDALINFIAKHKEALDSDFPHHTLWEKLQLELDKSPIEGFVEAHQSDFDTHEPPASLWANISEELEKDAGEAEKESAKIIGLQKPERTVSVKVVWQIAASFLLLLVASVLFQNWYLNQNNGELANRNKREEPSLEQKVAQLAPELLEAEAYYSQQISQKLVQLRSMDLAELGIDEVQFEQQIGMLDSAYTQMKTDLVESAANERVLNAMIENLQMRMEMLNSQLQILEKVNQIKQDKNNEIQI